MIDEKNREFFITALAICYINLSLLVGLAIRQWDGQPKNRGFPAKARKMLLFQSTHTGSGNHPASNSACTRIKMAAQFRLALKSSICRAVSPLPNTP